jgi:5-hydroxyisourate hydrolase
MRHCSDQFGGKSRRIRRARRYGPTEDFYRVDGTGVFAAATAPPAFAQPAKEPKLTLHVLDVYSGKPAAKVRVNLSVLAGANYQHLKSVNTAASGRNEQPLLAGQEIKVGGYELLFYVADYYRGLEVKLPDPPFLDKVPVRFAISDATQAYHIPLLVTPWSYSTYRGS